MRRIQNKLHNSDLNMHSIISEHVSNSSTYRTRVYISDTLRLMRQLTTNAVLNIASAVRKRL